MRIRRADATLVRLKKIIIEEHLARKLTVAQSAGLLAMHPKAFLRLKGRYKLMGIAAFWPKKPGPKPGSKPPANRTNEEAEGLVVKLANQYPFLGSVPLADKLFKEHGIRLNQSTIWRILVRRTDRYAPGRKRWKNPAKLYALDEPGAEVQMDACYPFGRARDVAVFDAVDDCSRWGCGDVYLSEDLPSAKAFIRKLVRTAPFRIRAIRLDNRFHGNRLERFCHHYGIRIIWNEPYHPEQNGKVERYHKTFKREAVWPTMSFFDPLTVLRYKLNLWMHHYNYERPHGGLAMHRMTPVQKLASVYLSKIVFNPQLVTGSLQQYTG